MSRKIRVSEIFGPTVQGEGPLIGRPTVFVRTGGCDYRCRWCDTLYAVLPEFRREWRPMMAEEVLAEIERLSGGQPILVSLSGGNPALQPLAPVIEAGQARGHRFALETQGSVAKPWFAALDWLLLSPKPPSAGVATDWPALAACVAAGATGPQIALKVAVFDEADYAFAHEASARHPTLPVYLQVGNPAPMEGGESDGDDLMRRFRWLVERVAADRWFAATVLPQLHVMAWGGRRGV